MATLRDGAPKLQISASCRGRIFRGVLGLVACPPHALVVMLVQCIAEKLDLDPQKNREKIAENESSPRNRLIFGYLSPICLGVFKSIFQLFLPYFGPRPEVCSLAGQGNRNPCPY